MTIREARTKAGLTQLELSVITGVPKRTIENWEQEKRTPPEYITRWVLRDIDDFMARPDTNKK